MGWRLYLTGLSEQLAEALLGRVCDICPMFVKLAPVGLSRLSEHKVCVCVRHLESVFQSSSG